MPSLWLSASYSTHSQITAIFDFVWPTAAAMWNLRWQVAGYLSVRPDADNNELRARFTQGSGINRVNLRTSCVDTTWENQQLQFAQFLLTNAFSIYESWLADALLELQVADIDDLVKAMQFPSRNPQRNRDGIAEAIATVTAVESPFIKSQFYPNLVNRQRNNLATLDNLLRAYRYYKELRNCVVHNGGVATDIAEQAYQQFSAVATPALLGLGRVPSHSPIRAGDPTVYTLSGVLDLYDLIFGMIVTIDSELSRALAAEEVFRRRWRKSHPVREMFPSNDTTKRLNAIRSRVIGMGLPAPVDTLVVDQFLTQHGLIF